MLPLKCEIRYFIKYLVISNRGSSGSVVSDYGLDDGAIEVRSPTGAYFSSFFFLVPGGKARPGRDTDHSPPSSAEVKNE
jgi:hypothetical protein